MGTAPIKRKKDTGEAGNPGQFGSIGRGEVDVQFSVAAQDGEKVTASRSDPATLPLEIEGYRTDAITWYDEDRDCTTVETTIYPSYDQVMGFAPGTEDLSGEDPEAEALYLKALPVMERIVDERFPDTDEGGSDIPSRVFITKVEGQATEREAYDAIYNSSTGFLRLVNEADSSTFGHEHLATLLDREMDDAVIPDVAFPSLGVSDIDDQIDQWRESVEMGLPPDAPSDADATALASYLVDEGDEISRVSNGLSARYSDLVLELRNVAADSEQKQYAVHALSSWADQNSYSVSEQWRAHRARQEP